jgi:hypothetical protein
MHGLFFLLAFAIMFCQAAYSFADNDPPTNLLHEGEFVAGTTLNPWQANPDDPWTPGVWNAEAANVIPGGLGASDGLIQVLRTTNLNSQVSQIVDVSSYADFIDSGGVFALFSVWLNAPASGVETDLMLRNLPAPQRPSIETRNRTDPILGVENNIRCTSIAPNVWQMCWGLHPLEPNTRFLHFEFSGINSTIPTSGMYFDSAVLTLMRGHGDFDVDGDADGYDFLRWQRGVSPNLGSEADFVEWKENFGTSGQSIAVPEPTTWTVIICALVGSAWTWNRRTTPTPSDLLTGSRNSH